MKQKYLIAALMAGMLVLAGCGGGNSSNQGDDGGGDTPPDNTPPMPTAESLSLKALGYQGAEGEALMKAMNAVNPGGDAMGSMQYVGMLTAGSVMGESMKVMENAQAVLDAQMAVDAAIMDAYDALMAAMDDLDVAMGLPAGADKDSVVEALEGAIAGLKMQFKTDANGMVEMNDDGSPMLAEASDDPKNLAQYKADVGTHVSTVEGDDMENPKTPSSTADMVAAAVLSAFPNAPAALDENPNTTTPGTVEEDQFFATGNNRSASAMTYDEIFNTQAVGLGNALVQGVPLSGEGNDDGTNAALETTDGSGSAAAEGAGSTFSYKGIEGVALCRMDGGCGVENGKLGDGWYFVPNAENRTLYYVESEDGGYLQATYAEYGMWMTVGNDGALTAINRYSDTVGLDVAATPNVDAATGSASYTGEARGLSAKHGWDEGQPDGHESGEFTADVSLKLDMGDSGQPTILSGTIDNFQGVHNRNVVDPRWTLKLELLPDVTVTELTSTAISGRFEAGIDHSSIIPNVSWSANPYGSVTHEYGDDGMINIPEGYHGAFNARFRNGGAFGVYAVGKDD